MKTLSIPTTASPEDTFRQGAVSPTAAPQGEVSFPDDPLDEWHSSEKAFLDGIRMLICSGIFAAAIVVAALVAFPKATLMVLLLVLSGAIIWFIFSWSAHRGDTEIGVSDTQGRDTTNTNP